MSSNRRTLSTKFTRGHAYHRLQMYQKALDDYDACLTIEPTCSFAFYNRGCALYAMGKKEAAVIDFGKAMKVDPKCTLYIESKAIVLKELVGDKQSFNMSDFSSSLQ
jgi:tetratricopeptide (TPR) repeat protein